MSPLHIIVLAFTTIAATRAAMYSFKTLDAMTTFQLSYDLC